MKAFIRNLGGENIKFKHGKSLIPDVVYRALDALLCRCISDLQEVTRPSLSDTLMWRLTTYNAEVARVNLVVEAHNRCLIQQFEQDPEADIEELGKSAWKFQQQVGKHYEKLRKLRKTVQT